MEASRLESLPTEIQARIYAFLFINQQVHIHDPSPVSSFLCLPRSKSSRILAILRTNKPINQDAEPHFYTSSIIIPCPCFLARTDTEDFEGKISKTAKTALQPLLRLWELRRTTQIYEHKFAFFSGIQQFTFSRDTLTGWLPLENLIPHVRKQGLSIWLRLPGYPDVRDTGTPIVWVKVDSTDTVTIFARAERYAHRVKEYLSDLKRSSNSESFILDRENTKFEIAELDIPDDEWSSEWLYDYHYEYCIEGRNAAVKKLGRIV